MIELNKEIHKSTNIISNINTWPSIMDKTCKWKFYRHTHTHTHTHTHACAHTHTRICIYNRTLEKPGLINTLSNTPHQQNRNSFQVHLKYSSGQIVCQARQ